MRRVAVTCVSARLSLTSRWLSGASALMTPPNFTRATRRRLRAYKGVWLHVTGARKDKAQRGRRLRRPRVRQDTTEVPCVNNPITSRSSSSTCRDCGRPIRWRETSSGKMQPIDPDGGAHFASCPKRERKNLPENACSSCGSLNVERGPGAGPHYARLRCLDCQGLRWLPRPRGTAP